MARKIRLLATATVAFGVAAGLAMAAPSNGDFETGNFDGWKTKDENGDGGAMRDTSKGRWQVYEGKLRLGGLEAPPPRQGMGGPEPKLPEPPQGKYAAGIASQGPGTHVLHRVLAVSGQKKLSLQLAYWNTADDFYTPDTLASDKPARRGIGPETVPNQQLRIDLMKPNAPIYSVKDQDIVKTIFRTRPGDDLRRDYKKLNKNVGGGEYRLRIAEVDNQSNFLAGVDAVKLKKR